jgi:hypothetical protein
MNQSTSSRRGARYAFLLPAFALAAACSGGSQGSQGSEGGPCYPNDTCNANLVCKAGTCVGAEGTGGHGSSSTAGTGGHGAGTGGATTSSTGTTGSGGAGASSSGSTSTTSSGTGGSAPANQPPVILTFGTNVTSITQGQQVTFTAIVTDPDGIGDVIGGTLLDGGGATYGAFSTSAQEGAYQVMISWDQIDQVTSIDFAQGATPTRTFKAQFFDQGGHTAEKTVDITLTCNGNGACLGVCKNMSADAANCGTCGTKCATGASCAQSACACPANQATVCSGVCRDLQNDKTNCGTCGHVCPAGASCHLGQCGALAACSTGATSCNKACQNAGKTCAEACVGTGGATAVGGLVYTTSTCSGTTPLNATCTGVISAAYSEKCCCF